MQAARMHLDARDGQMATERIKQNLMAYLILLIGGDLPLYQFWFIVSCLTTQNFMVFFSLQGKA